MKIWTIIFTVIVFIIELSAQIHPVYVEIRNAAHEIPEPEDIHFEAWNIGDILHQEVWKLSSNDWGMGEYILTIEACQFFVIDDGGITLADEVEIKENS